MSFEIIVTMGPSLPDGAAVREVFELAPCIFRINGSHSSTEEIRATAESVRLHAPSAKLMVDLPGNKVRTSGSFRPLEFVEGQRLELGPEDLNFPEFSQFIEEGDIVLTNDSLNSLTVTKANAKEQTIALIARDNGMLLPNKGIHVPGRVMNTPFLFAKDREILTLVSELEFDYVAISFVKTAKDIRDVRALMGDCEPHIIAKVERKEAVHNLAEILEETESILIDRGDLSNDVGMLNVPFCQATIVRRALSQHKRVYLATQFLKSMEDNSIPLVAEVMGLYNDISQGIAGIQLSEETAIGNHPKACVELAHNMYLKYQRALDEWSQV